MSSVEIDGTYIGGHVRKKNKAKDRIDRRLLQNQSGKRRCVLALRQRGGRIVTAVTLTENAEMAIEMARRHVEAGTHILTDFHVAYGDLGAYFRHTRVNHLEYSAGPGKDTNQVESFLARVKHVENGTHHKMAGMYLDWYVAELA